jgi:hypothetical protein
LSICRLLNLKIDCSFANAACVSGLFISHCSFSKVKSHYIKYWFLCQANSTYRTLPRFLNLHRNRRYFIIKLHTWFCLSYFLKTNIKLYCIYQYFMSSNSFFNTYLFLDTAVRLQWPVTHFSTFYQFFLDNVSNIGFSVRLIVHIVLFQGTSQNLVI